QGEGLLNSTLREARFASQHAGLASGATNIGGLHTHAEHTINILNGTKVDYDQNGSGQNPGTGIGIYANLDAIDQALQAVNGLPTAPSRLQNNAENIRVCLTNVRTWADQISALENEFLIAQDLDAMRTKLDESTILTTHLNEGFDQNENGQVEPFEGECGLQQIESFGLLVGSIELHEGGLTK
ncbi:MAG TPA: hypothetical protein VHL11_08230, partial [Phototrophicaceae bacterium]|nr:hypothetical protein [Phototrophicaceae bacterium]